MTKLVNRRGKKIGHMLITVEKKDIPMLRKRIIHKFIITLESCYLVVYAETMKQAIAVAEKNVCSRNFKSVEIAQ